MKVGNAILICLATATVLFILGLIIGYKCANHVERACAVAEGHAEFYLDDDNERQWRWLPPCREHTDET